MALSKEEWLKTYEHRFDKRVYKPKVDIFGNKKFPKNKPRRTKLKTPEWLLKGGEPPKKLIYNGNKYTYTKIRKC